MDFFGDALTSLAAIAGRFVNIPNNPLGIVARYTQHFPLLFGAFGGSAMAPLISGCRSARQ
jgi:hypothetical protein